MVTLGRELTTCFQNQDLNLDFTSYIVQHQTHVHYISLISQLWYLRGWVDLCSNRSPRQTSTEIVSL